MKFAGRIAILGMLVNMNCIAQTTKSDRSPEVSSAKLERMPESLEVRYAPSAAPPHLRDGATTYMLDPSGVSCPARTFLQRCAHACIRSITRSLKHAMLAPSN
jgi:hypothetical protein